MFPNFAYVRPSSLQQVVASLDADGAALHGGGTDLLGCLREHVFEVSTVVSLSALDELKQVQDAPGGGLSLGALVTLAELAAHQRVRTEYTGLAQGCAAAASPQLRNQGTIGGNINQKPRCWYYRGDFNCLRKGGSTCFAENGENEYHCIFGGQDCFIVHPSDPSPNLVALNAEALVQGPKGRRRIPLEDYFVLPEDDPTRETWLERGEVVTHIVLPEPPEGLASSYRKIQARRSWDFALAGLALAVVMDGPRVVRVRAVLSGVAPTPWRSAPMEDALTGKELNDQTIAQAAKAAIAGAKPLSNNAYKLRLVQGMVIEELRALAG